MDKDIDIVSIGEILIDFIGHQLNASINTTSDYHRYLGGSPTNVAINLGRLGLKSRMVATIGNDGFGTYILDKLSENNVNTEFVRTLDNEPTSVIFVSKTIGTPDFIAYRKADINIISDQLPDEFLKRVKIYHTTCFALSKNPARTTIINKAKKAKEYNCILSIDINYSIKIWPNRSEAIQVIEEYCTLNPLVKISEDDVQRLFGEKMSHKEIFNFFHDKGVDIVCLTLGHKGVKLSQKGKAIITLPAIKIKEIKDATGAGDAFWSGFLYTYLKKKSLKKCLEAALVLASIKLQNVGRLPQNIEDFLN